MEHTAIQGQSPPTMEVAERPTLAPNVQLIGEMQGTGFKDRQWLVQRGERFIQVTELLYRVAEQANGERRLDDIAEKVTSSTEWSVSAENVRQLIQKKLIPMGLVLPAGEAAVFAPSGRAPSPLALNLRVKVIGPRFIDPITKVLQFLYAPPVLMLMLVLIAIAHWWLYFSHGVLQSIVEILYTPGLLVLVLGITILATVFHEFGHASALRYGGGKVRGMGAGIYLIYPAFYTDTTDSYRLGRWARVRTDLGGFYFYLIWTLGIIGVYLATGQEWLLFIPVLINLDIIRQSIPFFRLDGYWVLADLTGVPDFLSQVPAFLRSLLPIPGEGDKLPTLKSWARAVFILYLVLTLPVLMFLLFLLVTRVPKFVPLIWDSIGAQIDALIQAWSRSDFLGILASFSQILILGLQLVGIAYLFYSLGRKLAGGLWKWSKPTPARRVAGALAGSTLVALLAFLWIPQLPSLSRTPPTDVQSFGVTGRAHVQTQVSYPQSPPVGGNHAPIWQNCGFYDAPVANENAVHSMEHGAVWIAYRPGLSDKQVDALRNIADRSSHVLVSPYPGLQAPVVASAWGRQLRLDSAEDPRLGQFVRAFRLGSQAPERGGPCTGGTGKSD